MTTVSEVRAAAWCRKLVTLPISTWRAVESVANRDLDNERFGGPPRSETEALRRLVILGLERAEASHGS